MIRSADDLRAVIRAHGADEPDPARVTEKILTSLTEAEAQVIAEVTLHDYVRHILTRPLTGRTPRFETASGQRTPSWKIAGVIDYVEAELRRSVYVPTSDEWKSLGDCTPDDLDAAAVSRRRKAGEVLAEAERYERLAALGREHDAEITRDLSRDVLAEVLVR